MKTKKLTIISAIFIVLFFHDIGKAEIPINGYDWLEWSKESKLRFVQGWSKAGESASNNLFIKVGEDVWSWNKERLDEEMKFPKQQIEYYQDTGVIIGGVAISQIMDAIDEIYSDSRTKNMDIIHIMFFCQWEVNSGMDTFGA